MKQQKYFAISWLLAIVALLGYLLVVGVQLNTNIYDLLLGREQSSDSTISLGRRLLEKGANEIKFGVESHSGGEESEELYEAAEALLQLAKDHELVLTASDRQVENFLHFLSRSKLYMLDVESFELISGPNPVEKLTESLQRKLSSPLGFVYSKILDYDPLLLSSSSLMELVKFQRGEYDNGIIYFDGEKSLSAVVLAKAKKKHLSASEQNSLVGSINAGMDELASKYKNLKFRWSGVPRFAQSSAARLKGDINFISTIAGCFVFVIVVSLFRGILPIFLTLFSVGVGLLVATVATNFFLGGIHLITIGFGSSLIGACVDYSVHYLCSKHFGVTSKSHRSIVIGATTSIIAFVFLLFADFPGLTELAVFSAFSILGSVITVFAFFEHFASTSKGSSTNTVAGLFIATFDKIKSFYRGRSRVRLSLLFAVISTGSFLLCIWNNPKIFNDDIRLLQPPEKSLLENEMWFINHLYPGMPGGYVFVSGSDVNELEKNYIEVDNWLRESEYVGEIVSLASVVGSKALRKQSYEKYIKFLSEHKKELIINLTNLGFSRKLIDTAVSISISIAQEPSLEVISSSSSFAELSLVFEHDGKLWGVIPLFGNQNTEILESHFGSNQNATFYSHPHAISKLFKSYREKAIIFLCVAYVFIWLVLTVIYGLRPGSNMLLPAILSALSTLAILALTGINMNFFSILALVIVLGLSVDYAVFSSEDKSTPKPAKISIVVSALTTTITFGLLLLSSSPVLTSFGSTIALGVLLSLLLTPLANVVPKKSDTF